LSQRAELGAVVGRYRHTLTYRWIVSVVLATGAGPFIFVTGRPALIAAAVFGTLWLAFLLQQSSETLVLHEGGLRVKSFFRDRSFVWSEVRKVTVTYAFSRTPERISEVRIKLHDARPLTIRMNWRGKLDLIGNLWPLLGHLAARRALFDLEEWQDPPRASRVQCEIKTRVWPHSDWPE